MMQEVIEKQGGYYHLELRAANVQRNSPPPGLWLRRRLLVEAQCRDGLRCRLRADARSRSVCIPGFLLMVHTPVSLRDRASRVVATGKLRLGVPCRNLRRASHGNQGAGTAPRRRCRRGTVTKWLKREGEQSKNSSRCWKSILIRWTPKIPAPASGTILKIVAQEGLPAKVGEVLAFIGKPGRGHGRCSYVAAPGANPFLSHARPSRADAARLRSDRRPDGGSSHGLHFARGGAGRSRDMGSICLGSAEPA